MEYLPWLVLVLGVAAEFILWCVWRRLNERVIKNPSLIHEIFPLGPWSAAVGFFWILGGLVPLTISHELVYTGLVSVGLMGLVVTIIFGVIQYLR